MIRPSCLYRLVVPLFALAAYGCTMFKREVPPLCPPVSIIRDTGKLVRYQPGQGRDIIDVLFEAEVANFTGACEYNKTRTRVTLELAIDFRLLRGPANRDRKAQFEYFVAIPAFHPAPQGKRVFPLAVVFPPKRSRVRVRDQIDIEMPVAKGRPGTEYPVYLGLQIAPEEINDNRRRQQR